MNKFIDWIKNCWKQVSMVVGMLAIIMGILTFDARYAKTQEVSKEFKQTEIKVADAIKEVKKSIELQQDISRLNTINDQLMQTKILLRKHPKDQDLIDDWEVLKSEKIKIQQKMKEQEKGN